MISRAKEIIGASARIYLSEMHRVSNTDYGPGDAWSCENNDAEYKYAISLQDRIAQEARIPEGLQKAIVFAADATPAAVFIGGLVALVSFNK